MFMTLVTLNFIPALQPVLLKNKQNFLIVILQKGLGHVMLGHFIYFRYVCVCKTLNKQRNSLLLAKSRSHNKLG